MLPQNTGPSCNYKFIGGFGVPRSPPPSGDAPAIS